MSTSIDAPFPYEEIRREDGDYYESWAEAKAAGHADDHIWSVVVADDEEDDRVTWWTYGPPHHYVNVIGFVATREAHDGETYYNEKQELD